MTIMMVLSFNLESFRSTGGMKEVFKLVPLPEKANKNRTFEDDAEFIYHIVEKLIYSWENFRPAVKQKRLACLTLLVFLPRRQIDANLTLRDLSCKKELVD